MSPTLRARLSDSGFWLLLAAISLGALHYFDSGNRIAGMERNLHVNRRAVFLICWLALAAAVWAKRGRRPAAPHPAMAALGCGLLTFTVARLSATLWDDTLWPLFWPLPAFVGLIMVGSTWREWGRFWREGTCLFLVLLNWDKFEELLERAFHFSKISAFVAEILLHLFTTCEVQRSGVTLTMGGEARYAVEVYPGCTGVPLVSVLGTMGLLICLLAPMSWGRRIWTLALAGLIGHGIGFIRVAWLAIVAGDHERFEFWHGPTGAGIFTTTSVVLYGFFQQRHLDVVADGRSESWLRGGPAETPRPRPPGLPRYAGCLALAAALTALAWVNYGRRELPAPALPETLASAAWTQKSRVAGKGNLPEKTAHTMFERVSNPVTYTLVAGGRSFRAEIRSVQGLIGGLDQFASLYEIKTLKSAVSNTTPQNTAEGQVLTNLLDGKKRLAAILPLSGESFVASESWGRRIGPLQRQPASLASWLFLAQPLADRRAWWIDLSSEEVASEKPLLEPWPQLVAALRHTP